MSLQARELGRRAFIFIAVTRSLPHRPQPWSPGGWGTEVVREKEGSSERWVGGGGSAGCGGGRTGTGMVCLRYPTQARPLSSHAKCGFHQVRLADPLR